MTILTNAATWIASINPSHPGYGTTAQEYIQSVHQRPIDFAQERDALGDIIGQWRGYRFWMGMTTIIPENPFVFASNTKDSGWVQQFQMDDVSWFDEYLDPAIGPVAEDAEILYDPTNDQIVCYWVRTDSTIAAAYGDTVTPGPGVMRRTYSNAGVLSSVACVMPWVDLILYANSPSVTREDATHWHMFGVVAAYGSDPTNALRLSYHSSADGITLGSTQYLGTVADFTAAYPGFVPNHVTAQINPAITGQIDLLINAMPSPAYPAWLTGHILVHAVVNLSDPTAITYPMAPSVILAPATSSWDDIGIYRSGFTLDSDGTNMTMRLWYSGIATDTMSVQSCRCGYTEGVIYQYDAGGIIAPADTTAPTVTAFTIPSTSTSLTVPITTLTATDDTAVTGYLLTESATPPLATDAGWSEVAPTEYTFASAGSKTLYAWAKDAAGNVSAGVSSAVEVTLATAGAGTISGVSVSASTAALSGVGVALVAGSGALTGAAAGASVGVFTGVGTATSVGNQIRAPNGSVRIIRRLDGTPITTY